MQTNSTSLSLHKTHCRIPVLELVTHMMLVNAHNRFQSGKNTDTGDRPIHSDKSIISLPVSPPIFYRLTPIHYKSIFILLFSGDFEREKSLFQLSSI